MVSKFGLHVGVRVMMLEMHDQESMHAINLSPPGCADAFPNIPCRLQLRVWRREPGGEFALEAADLCAWRQWNSVVY